jgi:N-terminal acetyltransferase B complex non-catalytic subunit
MFEEAYKAQPGNEELAAQTFFANTRTGNWKACQQVDGLNDRLCWVCPS